MLHERFHSIDIAKGILITLVLVLNFIFLDSVPLWSMNMDAGAPEGMPAGIVFSAVLFMIGVTVPFGLAKKINEGFTGYEIMRSVFARAVILITVGVLMVNTTRVDPELTGFGGHLWALLLYAAVFLVWNRYPDRDNNFFTVTGLRLLGLAILVFLVFKFRSGTFENNGSLVPGWWELPGLAGWGYLACALTFLAFRNSIAGTASVFALFLALNILNYFQLSGTFDPARPYFSILLDGYIPAIMLSGHLTGIILKKSPLTEITKPVLILSALSALAIAGGFILGFYVFTEGIFNNPSMVLVSSGIAALFFMAIFAIVEIAGFQSHTLAIKRAGINLLMTYILQFLLLNLVWISGADPFFFLKTGSSIAHIAGAIIWAVIVLTVANLLVRINIRLKF